MKKIILFTFWVCSFLSACCSEKIEITRIDPPNWWVGMKECNLQLCIYGKSINAATVSINYPGVRIQKVNKVENPDYLFVDLTIDPNAQPGILDILFTTGKEQKTCSYTKEPAIKAINKVTAPTILFIC